MQSFAKSGHTGQAMSSSEPIIWRHNYLLTYLKSDKELNTQLLFEQQQLTVGRSLMCLQCANMCTVIEGYVNIIEANDDNRRRPENNP